MLPIKTRFEDIDAVLGYLRLQVGWTDVAKMKTAIAKIHADSRKLDAMSYIGLIERDGANVKATEDGQVYIKAQDPGAKAAVLRNRIAAALLYRATFEWMFHQNKEDPTQNEIANYWHDYHQDLLDGAANAALTDAVIFFFRLADAAQLGDYVAAGRGRETHLKTDKQQIEAYVVSLGNGLAAPLTPPAPRQSETPGNPPPPPAPPPPPPPGGSVNASPAVHINVEIHIAADAKPATVEEIFKNMRKYVLTPPEGAGEEATT